MSNQSAHSLDLHNFSDWYANYHGYVSVCVCLGGIVTNTFNVTVLTRRQLRTPVNQILTGLAVSDIITMLSYLPFALHFYCLYSSNFVSPEKNSRIWMSFFVFHINLTTVTHTISIWLCVVLAVVRYLHIRSPSRVISVRHKRLTRSRYLTVGTYIVSIFVMIPNYLTNKIKPQPWAINDQINGTIYVLENLNLGSSDVHPLVLINVWMYAILAKLIPCFLISVFGALLLCQMRSKIKQRNDFLKVSASKKHKLQEHSRTTMMLILVIVLFLLTELPQGLLIILSACREGFFLTVYMPLGDLMDIGALVNNAINFILYCSMSARFRQTFWKLYCRCGRKRKAEKNGYFLRDEKAESFSNNNELSVL